ncbi:ABC transporter permease [Actinoplanes sp. HUAS TT8]|uniref:ABC transporter permease n=1 Tax=Actinoplanes sp. HUAS TT8 TaxID=3447453 RepID=UPI003F52560C
MIDSLSRIAALAGHNALLRLRDPGPFLSYLLMPMLGMFALKPLYLRAVPGGTTQVATGLLVMFSALALHIVGASTLTERGWHTWDRLRATRATTVELLLGKAIPVYGVLLLQQTILTVFGVVAVGLHPTGAAWLLAVAIATWGVALLAIGSALAAVVRSHGELHAICDIGALVVTTIGGALVPVALFPHWLQAVAPFSPGYWGLTMLQAAVRGDTTRTLTAAALLLAVALTAGSFACWRLARGWGRATLL